MIELKNFSFSYGKSESPNLKRINLTVNGGDFVLVCGSTGSGKSTLLKALVGLAPHFTGGLVSGTRNIAGQDRTHAMPHETAELIGYVNQQPEGSFVAETVMEELAFTLEQLGVPVTEMISRIEAALVATGLEHLRNRKLTELSGGQQQRVAVARALASRPQFVLADEPTANLDTASANNLLDIMWKLNQEDQMTFIFSTHDQRVIERANRVITLVDGKIVSDSRQVPTDH